MASKPERPPTAMLGVLTVVAALQLFDLVTHNDVLTAVLTLVVCAAYLGVWFWTHRYR
jgi:hypothetical protein